MHVAGAGRLAYVLTGIALWFRQSPFHVVVDAGGRRHSSRALQVAIANGRFYGGAAVSDEGGVRAGELRVRVGGRARLSLLAALVGLGLRIYRPGDEALAVRDGIVSSLPAHDVEIDAEVKAQTPVRIAVEPRALKVMVPAGGTSAEQASRGDADTRSTPAKRPAATTAVATESLDRTGLRPAR